MVNPPTSSWTWPASPCIPFNQSFWNYGEPNNRGGYEGCITVKYDSIEQERDTSKLDYMLNDLRCDVRLPFICSLTRCTDVGCGMSDTCKTQGDWKASCHSNVTSAVGYTCDCSSGYFSDDSGTCCRSTWSWPWILYFQPGMRRSLQNLVSCSEAAMNVRKGRRWKGLVSEISGSRFVRNGRKQCKVWASAREWIDRGRF
jgi:hypothetical protein